MGQPRFSAKAVCVLEMISEGYSYAQIIARYSELTYPDIFDAAAEALDLLCGPASRSCDPTISPIEPPASTASKVWAARLPQIQSQHPRAYEKWSADDDDMLRRRFAKGESTQALSIAFGRQPSAIQSRLRRLGLVK